MLVVICAVFAGAAQDKLRRVEQPAKYIYSNTPIEVVVNIDGKEMPSREIMAGSDWLKRVTLEITNTSGKDINWLWINLMLREPKYGATERKPENAGIAIPVELRHTDVKVLRAEERIMLKPPVNMVEHWTKYAREQGMEDIEKVILDIHQVGFTDDTAWTNGRFSRKDPESGRYLFITEKPEYLNSIFIPKIDLLFFDIRP
ncbi:MAG: hypothetical protein WBD16_05120 [Pyrinomonadaceae bacterium]